MDTPTALGEHAVMGLGIGALCAVVATVTTQRQRVQREFDRERERDRRWREVQRWREAQPRTKPVLVNAPASVYVRHHHRDAHTITRRGYGHARRAG